MMRLPSGGFNSSCGQVPWLIKAINHIMTVKQYDLFLTSSVSSFAISSFLYFLTPSLTLLCYFLSRPFSRPSLFIISVLHFLYFFSLSASFSCISMTFPSSLSSFRYSLFTHVHWLSYFSFHLRISALICCFFLCYFDHDHYFPFSFPLLFQNFLCFYCMFTVHLHINVSNSLPTNALFSFIQSYDSYRQNRQQN